MYGINPVLCVAQSGFESSFGTKGVAVSHPFNFWGFKRGSDEWRSFSSMEEAVLFYSNLLNNYISPTGSLYDRCLSRGQEYSAFSNKFSGTSVGIYEVITVYDPLTGEHKDNTKEKINAWGIEGVVCNHRVGEPTTIEEKAAHAIWYVESGLMPVAERVFGDLAYSTGGITDICMELTEILKASGTYHYPQDSRGNWIYSELLGDIRSYYYGPDRPGGTGICCADYVSMVLYYGNFLDAEFINQYNFHAAKVIKTMLLDAGWQQITYMEAEPGDIGVLPNHTFFMWENDTIWDQAVGQKKSRAIS